MTDVILPWFPKSFVGEALLKEKIMVHLRKEGYQVDRYLTPPTPSVIQGTCSLMEVLLTRRDNINEVPWVLLMSRDWELLQSLSHTVPIAMALTMRTASTSTTPDDLIQMYRSPDPKTLFDSDPVGDTLHKLRVTQMLTITDIGAKSANSWGYDGRLLGMLKYRYTERKMTMFTCVLDPGYESEECKESLNNALDRTRSAIGLASSTMIEQMSRIHILKSSTRQTKSKINVEVL